MRLFPASAMLQLEFDKIKNLLIAHCRTEYGKAKAEDLRIHTRKEFIELALQQSHEYKLLLQGAHYFPHDFVLNLSRELKLLGIPGAVLNGEDFVLIRKLVETILQIFRWFDAERKMTYPGLATLISETHYERKIIALIDEIVDEHGMVKDSASEELSQIRTTLYKKRNELRRVFDRVIQRLNKAGYIADIEESFLNGRRVVAIFAEHKRQIKGILHGESDTRRTSFIEPEETIELNNEIYSLENEERHEIYRILRQLTQRLSEFADLLKTYYEIIGEYDFTRAKAKLAIELNANYPQIQDISGIDLVQAYHPLLFLYNQKVNKSTIPVSITLDEKSRILVISGPNAGGKTVTLKTIGLLQMMIQSGLLVPAHPSSSFGIFKQLMIHIGDTQSLEFELSTYSSHLLNMKYFIENANGKTLFFIDELGSGSDPNLGGAFAEVILEELSQKHAYGIVTTHYLNLKIMANKTPGIINGAMSFDEKELQPLYQLIAGKPGSSYTFSIAERIGLDPVLIARARKMVDEDHFGLDKLLNRAEQDLRRIEQKEKELHKLMRENERLKKEMEIFINKEKHLQQVELLKQQNKIAEERIAYLKDMERKLKQIVFEWKKAENAERKRELMKEMQAMLFKQREKQVNEKVKKRLDAKFIEVGGEVKVGDKALMKQNNQVGLVKQLRGKKAVVQLGVIPITVNLKDLVVVKDRPQEEPQKEDRRGLNS